MIMPVVVECIGVKVACAVVTGVVTIVVECTGVGVVRPGVTGVLTTVVEWTGVRGVCLSSLVSLPL